MFLLFPLLDDKMDSPHKWYCDYIGATTGGNKAVMFPSRQAFHSHWSIFLRILTTLWAFTVEWKVWTHMNVWHSHTFIPYILSNVNRGLCLCRDTQTEPRHEDLKWWAYWFTAVIRTTTVCKLHYFSDTIFFAFLWKKKVTRSKPINTTSVNCVLIRSVWRIHDVISSLILWNSSLCGDFICSPHTSHFLQCWSSCSLLLSKPQWVHPASSISTKYLKYFGLNRKLEISAN